MTFDVLPLLPEIVLLALACGILILDTFLGERHRYLSYEFSQLALIVTAVITIALRYPEPLSALSGHFVRDTLGDVLKVFIYLFAFLSFLYGRDYLRVRGLFKGEYFVLGLFAVLGMMVMVSAGSLLTLYLGLELLALSLYAMVAMARDARPAVEAAMKYFVLGALASGMLLYGMSMIYGATGSLVFAEIAAAIPGLGNNVILVLGLVFVVVGLAFKLGAVPFHMWIPDVYHGAPTAVTLFLGSVPKLAAFAMAIRLLAEGLPGLHGDWQGMLIIMAVLSIAIGNIVAIAQANLKRMLAYSTISHVGFLLLGILAGTRFGYTASLFYTLAYAMMAIGAFGMILLLSRSGFEADRLEDFRGLNERSPWYAFIMLIFMFSMAGVPPSVGFFAKLYVLQAVVEVDLVWLAVAAVVFSVIGAFYYLRVVKLMYFDKPLDFTPLRPSCDARIALSANGLAVLALGVFPGALLALCLAAFP